MLALYSQSVQPLNVEESDTDARDPCINNPKL